MKTWTLMLSLFVLTAATTAFSSDDQSGCTGCCCDQQTQAQTTKPTKNDSTQSLVRAEMFRGRNGI